MTQDDTPRPPSSTGNADKSNEVQSPSRGARCARCRDEHISAGPGPTLCRPCIVDLGKQMRAGEKQALEEFGFALANTFASAGKRREPASLAIEEESLGDESEDGSASSYSSSADSRNDVLGAGEAADSSDEVYEMNEEEAADLAGAIVALEALDDLEGE